MLHFAAAFEPKVYKTEFEGATRDVHFFEDSSHIATASGKGLRVSFDDGASWEEVKATKGKDIGFFAGDPYMKERALAFSMAVGYYTTDRGKTWKEFDWGKKDGNSFMRYDKLLYNVADKNMLLFMTTLCPDGMFPGDCKNQYYYTTDGLKLVKKLPVDSELCIFAKSNKDFDFSGDSKTIICVKHKLNSFGHVMESSIVSSNDFFKSETDILNPGLKNGRVLDLTIDASFMVATVLSDRFNQDSQVSFFVSKNGKTFEKSNFKAEMNRGAIKFLPSSKLGLFVEVAEIRSHLRRAPVAKVFKSDSQGINFDVVAEDVMFRGFEKVDNFDGVWVASKMKMSDADTGRHIPFTSMITLNDGKDWQPLLMLDDDSCKVEQGCSLHLYLVRTFDTDHQAKTGPTANILLGIGNVGSESGHFDDLKTFVSRDGGLTWTKALDEPAMFSFGDQGNVILAVPPRFKQRDKQDVNYYYSLDQGLTWDQGSLGVKFSPMLLSTTTDGTTSKFFLGGQIDLNQQIYTMLDFSKAYGATKCKDKDLEKVYARVVDGKPLCHYGHKESVMRRKPDAKCFVSKIWEDLIVKEEPCECTEADFECSKYFKLSPKGACVPNEEKIKEACSSKKSKKVKLADKQLSAGNLCKQSNKETFVAEEEFNCEDYADVDKPLGKKLVSVLHEFEGRLEQYSYVKAGDRENLLVRTSNKVMFASNDGGSSFTKVPVYEKIDWFAVGATPGSVVLITDNEIFYYSKDGGNSFSKLKAPSKLVPTRLLRPSFHPTNDDKFIWYGSDGCDPMSSPFCEVTAYHTRDGGQSFDKLRSGVQFCDYISMNNEGETNLIYCLTSGEKPQLLSSTNYFRESSPKVLFDNVASYALKSNYVIVATVLEGEKEMRAKVTVDGSTFADASFPKDFKVEAQTAYNILDSADHSIFMHVTTDGRQNKEVGSLLKSNSNGTYYVLSLKDVNRGKFGFVDYDRIQALEGIILANTVSNPGKDEKKKLKTVISFNDGSEWAYLSPPTVDSEGKKFKCSGLSLDKCSLHLQSFTERPDFTDTYGSSSAVGVLFGVGNVGEYLGENDLATYMSRDAGLTWKEVVKGQHMWEFGDQGTVLVLVDQLKETNSLTYSTNGGEDWQEYKFADKNIVVLDLATVQSDTSLKFVIFVAEKLDLQTTHAYSIDFTNYFSRQCELDLENPKGGDFEYWSPKRPFSKDNCLFGREVKYLRRKNDRVDCFIGAAPLKDGFEASRVCTCTRADYECDYNYYRDSDGTCKLVDGLSPADRMKEMCEKEGTFQYFEPTGYRKIPLSKCEGGKGFDSLKTRPCPGHESEYNDHYGVGLGGGRIFGVIFAPIVIFIVVFLLASWFVYERGIRRNGGFERLGQIRLDDDDDFQPIEENAVDVAVNKVVKGGIVVVAGTVAAFKTIRKIDRALLERISLALFGRRSGHRNYVRVPDDEDELFGNFDDNYEDELENAHDIAFEIEDSPGEFSEYADEPPVGDDQAAESDERLFDIDDQSEDDNDSSRRGEE